MYKINYFNFKKENDEYLITNDAGEFVFLSEDDFSKLMKKEKINVDKYEELEDKGFIYNVDNEIFATKMAQKVRNQKNYTLSATSLHIFVVDKNCNFNCIYCQAGNLNQETEYKMTRETARKAVDIAMQSPSQYLTFEFQGGEPLMNFEVIKYIVEYSKGLNTNKHIEYSVVSNLTLLTDEMINFFKENNIGISTSIDGDEELQNINRPYKNGNSYIETIKQIKRLQENEIIVNAIQTTSKYSLNKYREIVDEYIKLGLNNIFIRPLTKLGKANKLWKNIGYDVEDFLEFYKKALDYIIKINKEEKLFIEGHARIFLKKILNNVSENYMELRSPCGAAIGQLAYYYDGNIYTCDEARMLSEMGDDSFKIGNVFDDTYLKLMQSDSTKAMCISSCLECNPICNSCVYMPYCGVCPVVNLAEDKNLFSREKNNFRCKIYSGILDILFEYIKNDKEALDIFYKWIN